MRNKLVFEERKRTAGWKEKTQMNHDGLLVGPNPHVCLKKFYMCGLIKY